MLTVEHEARCFRMGWLAFAVGVVVGAASVILSR